LVQQMIETPTADPRELLAKAEAARSEILDAHQGNRLDQSQLLCLSALDDAIQFFMHCKRA
jgi:hypothetical protein